MDLNSAINATISEYGKRSSSYIDEVMNAPIEEVQETEVVQQPVDFYEATMKQNRSIKQRSAYGTRPYTREILKQLKQSPVQEAYKKAMKDIEYLKSAGDKQRADVVRQQYMEDYYMPAVDAAVRLGSRQDVLSSKEILDSLDSLVILDGVRGNGYTASLVSNLYEEGEGPAISDIDVQQAVENIVRHCNNGNIGVAIGLAKRIKEQIDSGNNVAIPEDYEIIEKVAIRGE